MILNYSIFNFYLLSKLLVSDVSDSYLAVLTALTQPRPSEEVSKVVLRASEIQ